MLKIRLQRIGRKNDPSFRAVVVDSRQGPKSGKYVERVGSYDPRVDRISLESDRIRMWIEKGAQVSDTLHNLLISEKIIEGKKINVLPKKTPFVASDKESPPVSEQKESASSEKAEEKVEESVNKTEIRDGEESNDVTEQGSTEDEAIEEAKDEEVKKTPLEVKKDTT